MLKKIAVTLLVVAAVGGGLSWVMGLRVSLDGSGMIPRYVAKKVDYDALDADRARQKQQALPVVKAAPAEVVAPMAAPVDPAAEKVAPPRVVAPRAAAGRPIAEWSAFRGASRDGRFDAGAIRTTWPSEGLRQLWKQPIGLGYASFSVASGYAYTIEQRRRQEVVAAYELETGREVWTHGWDGEFVESMGGDGPRTTPTYHDGRIYALGAMGELRCLDARTGALVWRQDILADAGASNLQWGMAASPLIVDDAVVVLPGGSRGKSVAAYDRTSGKLLWTTLDDPQAYTSPMLATIGGVRQIVVVTARRAVGLAVDGGRLLWEYPWVTDMAISVAQPVLVGADRVFLSASYGHGAAVFEVTRSGDAFSTRTVWANNRMKNKFTSSVLRDGYLYGMDEAILACIDAATGELKWKGGRYGYGQVLLAGDHLVVQAENGDVALVSATPDRYRELARFGAISGRTWNHPVVASGRLLVRNAREMAAFDIRP